MTVLEPIAAGAADLDRRRYGRLLANFTPFENSLDLQL